MIFFSAVIVGFLNSISNWNWPFCRNFWRYCPEAIVCTRVSTKDGERLGSKTTHAHTGLVTSLTITNADNRDEIACYTSLSFEYLAAFKNDCYTLMSIQFLVGEWISPTQATTSKTLFHLPTLTEVDSRFSSSRCGWQYTFRLWMTPVSARLRAKFLFSIKLLSKGHRSTLLNHCLIQYRQNECPSLQFMTGSCSTSLL